MSERVITQMRRNQEPAGFQIALRKWREFAHRRGLVVASSTRLIGAERTFYGDSDDVTFGPKDYKLINADLLFDDLPLSKKDKEILSDIADTLMEMSEVDIKDCRVPESAKVERLQDERDRWEIMLTNSHRVGTVVRTGEGSKKRYMLYLWDGGWYLVSGQPCFDLPMFGLPLLRDRPEAPVMIHEGPKAWQGALKVAAPSNRVAHLSNWMSVFVHVGWHGSDIGMEWTDWSPLRGRKVVIWPDMDEAGLANARMLAKRIAEMGGIVEYVQWGSADIENFPSWDWGDPLPDGLRELTRTDLRERMQRVESVTDAGGRVLQEWAKRSFYDPERQEVYMVSRDYRPLPLASLRVEYGAGIATRITNSTVNPFVGTDYRPGLPFGRMKNGKINLCPQHLREPIRPTPLPRDVYEEIGRRWLKKMIPDPIQRKHLVRRAAWAIARPEKVSQHMIVMQGESGIGKSVLLDLIARIAGSDRAASLFPDSILSRFNAGVAHKSIVCIHEIHSDDMTRKQNASRLKELIANETIITEEKNRPRVAHTNVVHWFAATNERTPFSLEHGNDRFFFIRCETPRNSKERKRKDRFFADWLPRFHDNLFLDELYAAAKWLVSVMPDHRVREVVGRARRQTIWQYLEKSSLRAWEQFLLTKVTELMEQDPGEGEDHPPCFFGHELVNLVMKQYPGRGPIDVSQRLIEFGYRTLRDSKDGPVKRRLPNGYRAPIWVRAKDLAIFQATGNYGRLVVRSIFKSDL